ncbi:MAG: hypothetical protein JKY19_08370 [Alcanivoracaceae bacterium]|nr:hypothetical protein [Alcanivoracaceae bacterium]
MKKYNYISLLICLIIFSLDCSAVTPAADTIVIDDVRNLQIDENTSLTIDRRSIQSSNNKAAEQFGTGFLGRTVPGFKARINYTEDGSANNGGVLSDINLLNSVIGPVTINDGTHFQALFVELVIDADTVIQGIDDISQIQVGDIVAASGMETEDGNVKVTRLDFLAEGSPYWLITGDIANLSVDGLDIGSQHINISNNPAGTIILCGNETLENDLKVIIDLEPKPEYTTGDALNALAIICYEDFEPPVDPPNNVFFNGDIEQVNADQSQITVAGTIVHINADTQIISEFGPTHLEVGMNVSINGYEAPDSNDVIAEFIIINNNDPFPPPPFPIVLFGQASNVDSNSFSLQGLTIQINDTTEYFNGVAADLLDGVLIEVIATAADPANQPPESLTAIQITFIDEIPPGNDFVRVEGEISNLNAEHTQFSIADEVVDVGPETVIIGVTIDELANGLNVLVEGFRDSNSGHVNAEFIVTEPSGPGNPPGHVCLSGVIESVNADQSQFVLANGAIVNVSVDTDFIQGTQADLVVGVLVDVAGIVSDTSGEIEAEIMFFTPDLPPEIVFFSGFITQVATDNSQITVDDSIVNISVNTVIHGGSIESLDVGIEVQVEGIYNANNNEIDAESITIPGTAVAAAAPVLPEDITISDAGAENGVIVIMGIEVHQNELTWDFSDVFINGIDQEQTVAFYGYQDTNGVVWAYSIFTAPRDGNPGTTLTDLFLQGRVTHLDTDQLAVMEVNIGNLAGATYLDADYQEISALEFMADLSVGDLISVYEAQSYDRSSNTLNAGIISKQNSHGQLPNSSANNKAGGNTITGSGIVTSVIEDVIFGDTF